MKKDDCDFGRMLGRALSIAALDWKEKVREDGKPYLFHVMDSIEVCASRNAMLGCALYGRAQHYFLGKLSEEDEGFPTAVIEALAYIGKAGASHAYPSPAFFYFIASGPALAIEIVMADLMSHCDPKKMIRAPGKSTIVMRSSTYRGMDILDAELERRSVEDQKAEEKE